MVALRFGIESGSQKILDIMEKKFTTKDIYNGISNCKKAGINPAIDAFMFAMVGETKETVIESAEFIASLMFLTDKDWNIGEPACTMAYPATPLYEYCQQIGIIGKSLDEEEDYLMRTSELNDKKILNYLNKTDSSIKEVHYWLYLYHYAGKKAYVDLIIKNNKSIRNRLLQIYEKCIKGSCADLIGRFSGQKNYYKNKKLLQKMKWYAILSANLLLSLIVPFFPKVILFPIIRVYADLRFFFLKKKYKVKKGKQKYNLFAEQTSEFNDDFRFTENRVAKTSRRIERSLRSAVIENRKQMNPITTDEERDLRILTQGQ